MIEQPTWKLIVKKPDGDDVSYYYTHHEMQFPESRAQNAGFKTAVVNLEYQRKWWKLRTEELIERVRTGMATMQDATMIEKFVFDYNDVLPDEEKFIDKG